MREKEVMNRITASWNPEAPFFVRLVIIQLICYAYEFAFVHAIYVYL